MLMATMSWFAFALALLDTQPTRCQEIDVPSIPLASPSDLQSLSKKGVSDATTGESSSGDELVNALPTLIRLEPISKSKSHSPVVTALAMTSDRQRLIAAGDDHVIRVIDLQTGETIKTLIGHIDWVRAVEVAADGSWVLSCGNDGSLRRWNVETGTYEILFKASAALMTMAVDAAKNWVACAGFSNDIWIIDLRSGDSIKKLHCHGKDQRALAFSNDGKLLASGGRDGTVRVWDWQSDNQPAEQSLHRERIRSIRFSSDAQVVTTVGEDRRLIRYDFVKGQVLLDHKIIGGKLLSMTDVDESTVAVAGSDNTIRWVDVATGAEIQRLIGHDGSVAVMLCDGKILISGSFDTTIRTWNLSLAKRQARLEYEHPVSARFHDSGVSEKLR